MVEGATLAGEPLYDAGVDRGALVTRVNGVRLDTIGALERALEGKGPGDVVRVEWTSWGGLHQADVRLIEHPALTAAPDEILEGGSLTAEERAFRGRWLDARAAAVPEGAVAPLGLPDNVDDHLSVTYYLMLLAFQADISRVFTFMVGHEGSGRSYAHIGIPEPHHPVSHHGDTAEGIAKYAKLTTYHVTKLSEFVGKLQETQDGDGSLLDRSLLYFGSGMGNGNVHDRQNPPALLVGGANGRLKGNRAIVVDKKEPTANLLLAMGELAGAEIDSIGHSTGTLSL